MFEGIVVWVERECLPDDKHKGQCNRDDKQQDNHADKRIAQFSQRGFGYPEPFAPNGNVAFALPDHLLVYVYDHRRNGDQHKCHDVANRGNPVYDVRINLGGKGVIPHRSTEKIRGSEGPEHP